MSQTPIAQNLDAVLASIAEACLRAGRHDNDVRVLPVSKTQPLSVIREAMAAGCRSFGENRVQDMAAKAEQCPQASWEMIGHLQHNKARAAVRVMSMLHSLDSLELARKLHVACSELNRTLDVLVQVNTSGESTKYGIPAHEVMDFTGHLSNFPLLKPRGLMTIAHPSRDLAAHGFDVLARLRTQLQDRDGPIWSELSMGMSGDFDLAIAHGSTCVRIGTAIFGSRHVQ
ncbi:MAG: YggS family pyridoxal phosphate-dependent enzyme [Propionibacteriaceae bacterium]|nr:YggS family pyridoxal phosphate-dependent enzyme [Propionibacteriaceae bacterium]